MKDKTMLPPLEMYGEPRVVAVPDSERVKFLTEAVLMSNLHDQHVVGCFGIAREPPQREDGSRPPPKLLQEFCPDGTLLDRIRRPRYSTEQALMWLRETALGMACLHETGGMHRDLKPEKYARRLEWPPPQPSACCPASAHT
jgi:serine/threonine protein kinase